MLVFLDTTYRGRTHQWWLQSAIMLFMALLICFLTYYFINLSRHFQLLKAEHKALVLALDSPEIAFFSRVNETHDYLQYLTKFEVFEKKAKLAKWMRVYNSEKVFFHHKNYLELALTRDMVSPVLISLNKALSADSLKWENLSVIERNKMQPDFKQRLLAYEMVIQHQGNKILASDKMREIIIRSWYEAMQKQVMAFSNYQEIYPKLEKLLEFYYQTPIIVNRDVKADRALVKKYKHQLDLDQENNIYISKLNQ